MTDSRQLRDNPEIRRIDRELLRLEAQFDKTSNKDALGDLIARQVALMTERAQIIAGPKNTTEAP